jgi:AsmA protein
MKKTLIIIGSIIAFIIFAAVVTPYFFKAKITAEAKEQINKNVDADVNFDDLSLSLFRHFPNLAVTFENIKVSGKEEFRSIDLFRADELTLGLNPWKILFGNETEVSTIKMRKPFVDVYVLKNGCTNYDIFIADTTKLATNDTTSSLNLELDKIVIENGDIIYDDRSSNFYMEMTGVQHEGKIELRKDIFDLFTKTKMKELTMEHDHVRYLHRKDTEIDVQMELNTKENRFTFRENSITLNHFKVTLEGSFAMLANGYDMDLKFNTPESEFKDILSLVPGIYKDDFKHVKTDGDITVKGFVKGVLADSLETIPRFHIDVNIKDGMFKIDTLPTPVNNIQIDLAIENTSGVKDSMVFDLKDFKLDLGKYPVRGRCKLTGLSAQTIDTDIFADIDMTLLETIYPIKGIDIKGKLSFELMAKGDYHYVNEKIKKVPAFDLNLKVSEGRFKYDSLPSAIENIGFQLIADNPSGILEETAVRLNNIRLDIGKNPITGYVFLQGYEKYKIDADIKADLDLADMEKIHPIQGISMKGLFGLDIKAKGFYDHAKKKFPAVDAKVQIKNAFVKTPDYPEPVENINLTATILNNTGDFKNSRLDITDLTYTLEDEPFEIKGTVMDLEDYAFDLKMTGRVDLEKITKIYPLEGVALKGIIDSDVSTQGKISDVEEGRYRKIKSSGKIDVKNFEAKSSSMPLITIKDALFIFTPEKVRLERFIARMGKSNINMTGDLTNYIAFLPSRPKKPGEAASKGGKKPIVGDLILNCDSLDVNEWIKPNPPAQNTVARTNQPADTSKNHIVKISERFDFVFDSKIDFVKYDDFRVSKLDGEIRVKDGIVSLKETGFNSLNAVFNLSGDYDTRDLNHPLFDFSIDIKDLDIRTAYNEIGLIRQLAPAAANAEGSFSINYKLKGELDQQMQVKTETMVGGGEIKIVNAKINGMKIFDEISKTAKRGNIKDPHLKEFIMDTEIRDNKIFIKPFALDLSGFETDIEGVSDLNGNTIAYVFKIELLPIQKLKIPFHVTGTYDKPKVSIGKGHVLPE